MFFIRAIFWFSLVMLFIPIGDDGGEGGPAGISGEQTLAAVQAAAHDLAGFCERNPATCNTAGALVIQYGQKVRTGAGELVARLDEKLAATPTDAVHTGSVSKADE